MVVKTFRGLLADNTVETIALHTNDGTAGYRIRKFQIIPNDPTDNTSSAVMKIYTTVQTAATRTIDFSDQTLLGVALYSNNTTLQNYPEDIQVIFDGMTFNQDIYVTLNNAAGNDAVNYYIELEQLKLNLNEATVATLKDIRNVGAT